MKLKDFLLTIEIDILDGQNQGANIIKTGLFDQNRLNFDFEKDTNELTDEEVHDVFYALRLEGHVGLGALFCGDIIYEMRKKIKIAEQVQK